MQKALGLEGQFLARRVFAALDFNQDGTISREEFVAAVRAIMSGTDKERLAFAFRVHDSDGDGSISFEELHRMIALSLAESRVIERRTQSSQKLAETLFTEADRNRDGRIAFDEFAAVVMRHPRLLSQMTRSEAQRLAPNEALLAWLDDERTTRRRWLPSGEDGIVPRLVLLLFIAANVGLLVGATWHAAGPPRQSIVMALGRALGTAINWNGALLLVPVMRRLLTHLRASPLGRVVPIDSAVTFHRIVGHTLVAFGLAHAVLLTVGYHLGHPSGSTERLLFSTERGLTGVALLIVIGIMWAFALSFVRRTQRFELFYFSHLLSVVWFALAIAHAPSFLFWCGVPLLGFGIEQALRLARRGRRTALAHAEALRSGTTRLDIVPPPGFTYAAGDYVFVRIPAIAQHEWHPFTVSSAPESGQLTLHVRTLGNWTTALRSAVEAAEAAGSPLAWDVFVDGPYGSPSAHIYRSRFAVFIGAGIGVTPFASVLGSMFHPASERPGPERVHFFWLNRDAYSFEWFGALLSALEAGDTRARLDIHLCMTGGHAGATALGLEAARATLADAGRSDVVTGLRSHTHLGPPDWHALLDAIVKAHAPEPVEVFFCGPAGLARKVQLVCRQLGVTFRKEQF